MMSRERTIKQQRASQQSHISLLTSDYSVKPMTHGQTLFDQTMFELVCQTLIKHFGDTRSNTIQHFGGKL